MENKKCKALKAKYWLTEVYLESCAPDWLDYLRELQLGVAVSPCHDKDVKEDGNLVKPHHHLILEFPNTTTISFPQQVVDRIGGVGCFQCISVKGSTRYLTHMDNPEKYQYNPDDIMLFGGFDYEKYIHMESDDHKYLKEILKFIVEYKVYSFRDLTLFAMTYSDSWFNVIAYRSSVFLKEFMKSCVYSDSEDAQKFNPLDFRQIDGMWYSAGAPVEL